MATRRSHATRLGGRSKSHHPALAEIQYCYVNGRMMRDRLSITRSARPAKTNWGPISNRLCVVSGDRPTSGGRQRAPRQHEVRFHQSRLVHDFIYQGVLACYNSNWKRRYRWTMNPNLPAFHSGKPRGGGAQSLCRTGAREPVAPRYTPAPASVSRPAPPGRMRSQATRNSKVKCIATFANARADAKIKSAGTAGTCLAANSQSFGRVLTIVHSDCACWSATATFHFYPCQWQNVGSSGTIDAG